MFEVFSGPQCLYHRFCSQHDWYTSHSKSIFVGLDSSISGCMSPPYFNKQPFRSNTTSGNDHKQLHMDILVAWSPGQFTGGSLLAQSAEHLSLLNHFTTEIFASDNPILAIILMPANTHATLKRSGTKKAPTTSKRQPHHRCN